MPPASLLVSDSPQSWYQPTVRTCYKPAWSYYGSLLALSGQVHLVFCATTPCPLHSCASPALLLIPKVLSEESSIPTQLSSRILTSLSSWLKCSFPLVNRGHVVVVFLFLKLLIWTCCLCLHHWTEECFPVPMSGCVVSHAPALC